MQSRVPGNARPAAALVVLVSACAPSAPPSSRDTLRPPIASEWVAVGEPALPRVDGAPFDHVDGTWVLHVGDSFVGGPLAASLAGRFEAVGAREAAVAKQSTSTFSWAEDPDLDEWLARKPALVLVTLGANEVDNAAPARRAGVIHAIARKVGAVAPCVWIAPALWKEDRSGWLDVLHDHCDPCLFFDSDAVLGGLRRDERRPDGIHPNERGGGRWADALWGWLEEHRDRERGGWALLPYVSR